MRKYFVISILEFFILKDVFMVQNPEYASQSGHPLDEEWTKVQQESDETWYQLWTDTVAQLHANSMS